VGALAAGLAASVSLRLVPPRRRTVQPLKIVKLMPGFLWASFLGGLDVIWRAFHPRMPLNPGWIVHRSRLPSSAARVALGSDLSLMPGTLAAGGRGDHLHPLPRRHPGGRQPDRQGRAPRRPEHRRHAGGMADILLVFAAIVLLAVAASLIRIYRGPTPADRMMGAQIAGTGGIAIVLLIAFAGAGLGGAGRGA
jgi:hypothetical protein